MQALVSWLIETVVEIGLTLVVLVFGLAAARAGIERLLRHLSAAAEAPASWLIGTITRIATAIDELVDLVQRVIAYLVHIVRLAIARPAGGRRSHRLFRGSRRDAVEAAASRRSYVRRALARGTTREIIEVPPGVADVPGLVNDSLSPAEQAGQQVRLAYQQADELLLFGRVHDCLVYLARLAAYRDLPVTPAPGALEAVRSADPVMFDLSLRRLSRWERRKNDFGWIATIGTPDPAFFRQSLLDLRQWLGIGVEFARLSPAAMHAKPKLPATARSCEKTPANVGTVAGMVRPRAGGGAYALTCNHVIPQCPNLLFADGPPGGQVPDAVLAHIGAGCFALGELSRQTMPALSAEAVNGLLENGVRLRRVGGYSRRYAGYITDAVASYRVGQRLHAFPACKVVLHRLVYFGCIPWPLFRRRYSLPGDSGAWVVAPAAAAGEPERLLGMVHAGGVRGCYVILAAPLLDYFETRARQAGIALTGLSALPFKEGVP